MISLGPPGGWAGLKLNLPINLPKPKPKVNTVVKSSNVLVGGSNVTPKLHTFTGLKPNTDYTIQYSVSSGGGYGLGGAAYGKWSTLKSWRNANELVEQVIDAKDTAEKSGTIYSAELKKTLDIAKIEQNLNSNAKFFETSGLNTLAPRQQYAPGANLFTKTKLKGKYANRYTGAANANLRYKYVIKKAGTTTALRSSSNGIIQLWYRPSPAGSGTGAFNQGVKPNPLYGSVNNRITGYVGGPGGPGIDVHGWVGMGTAGTAYYQQYLRLVEFVTEKISDPPQPNTVIITDPPPPPPAPDKEWPKIETILKPGKWSNWNVYKTQTKKLGSKSETKITVQDEWTEYANTFNGATALSEVSLYFDYIQTFTIDKAAAAGSGTVTIDSVELFFKKKPHYKNNVSGIENPAVSIYLCETTGVDKVPDLSKALKASVTRLNYNEINSSLYADSPTVFQFKYPLTVPTDKTYGIVINYEDPTYSLWFGEEGKPILKYEYIDGAYSVYTSGSSNNLTARNYIGGKLFVASNYQEIDNDPSTKDTLFKAINSKDIKFNVNVRKYDITQDYTIELTNDDYDFIRIAEFPYDEYGVPMEQGQSVYQTFGNTAANCEFRASGEVAAYYVPASDTLQSESGITFSEMFYLQSLNNDAFLRGYEAGDSIILSHTDSSIEIQYTATVAGLQYGFNGITRLLLVGNPGLFANNFSETIATNSTQLTTTSSTRFHITKMATSELEEYRNLADGDILLKVKNTNSYFQNKGINYVAIQNGGTGYANGDWFDVPGTYDEQARIQVFTDNLGIITDTIILNPGSGYTDTSGAISIYKNTFNPSVDPDNLGTPSVLRATSGNSSVFTFYIGGQIKQLSLKASADIISIDDVDVNTYVPNLSVSFENASATNYEIVFAEYNNNNEALILNNRYTDFTEGVTADIRTYDAKLLSRSNEIDNFGTLGSSSSEGKSSIIRFDIRSTNAYESPELIEALASVHTFSNEINDDDTDEVLPESGEAVSRHISNKIEFGKDRFAEDIRVIVNAWKPPSTDFKVYAKIHNSADEDSFDDKYWTELEVKDYTNERQYSSATDESDTIQFEYGFRPRPILGARNFAIDSITKTDSNNTIVVITQGDHNLSTGHYVTISGATDETEFNGTGFGPITVISNTSFAYANSTTFTPTADIAETSTDDDVIFYKRYLDTSYTGSVSGTTITISSTEGIEDGDALFIYDPDFKEEKNVVVVVDGTPNAGDFEITEDLTNSQMQTGSVQFKISLIDDYSLYQAFNNVDDNNIVRYLNSANTIYDYYDSMSVKIVPLSPSKWIVPHIDDISVIGVSA